MAANVIPPASQAVRLADQGRPAASTDRAWDCGLQGNNRIRPDSASLTSRQSKAGVQPVTKVDANRVIRKADRIEMPLGLKSSRGNRRGLRMVGLWRSRPPPDNRPMEDALMAPSRRQWLLRSAALGIGAAAGGAGMLVGCSSRDSAPDAAFVRLDGSGARISELRGKVLLVNFWATSCATCVAEMPGLIDTHRRFNARGYETLAVAMSYDPPAYVSNFAQRRELPFWVAIDNTGAIAKAFGEKDLEELVLEGLIDLFVHGLSLFWLSTFRLKALNRRCKSPQGSGTPCVIPIPLHRDHAR